MTVPLMHRPLSAGLVLLSVAGCREDGANTPDGPEKDIPEWCPEHYFERQAVSRVRLDTGSVAPPEDTGTTPADTGAPPSDTGAPPADSDTALPVPTAERPEDPIYSSDTGHSGWHSDTGHAGDSGWDSGWWAQCDEWYVDCVCSGDTGCDWICNG